MNVYVSPEIIDFYRYIHHMLFNFKIMDNICKEKYLFFLHEVLWEDDKDIYWNFDYKMDNWYLYLLDFVSLKSLINLSGLLWLILFMFSVALIWVPFFFCARDQEPNSNRYQFFKNSILLFVGSFPLRLLLLSFNSILLSSLNEISSLKNILSTSYLFSMFLLITVIAIFLVWIIKWWQIRLKENTEHLKLTKELFNGIRDYPPARFYPIMWISRRILFVWAALFLKEKSHYISWIILGSVQIIYFLYIIIQRPFKLFKDNISEIMNEVIVIWFISFNALISKKDQWNSLITLAYLGVIFLNNLSYSLISIGKFYG